MATTTPRYPTAPELLAPAGDWQCAKAAVANGADAIYFGLDCGFNARARAANFSLDDLDRLIAFLARYGVRGYVALNTLVFSDELESVEDLVRRVAEAGADAVLVQDLGLVQLIRRTAPGLSIHASTQMTLTSAECIAMAEEMGIERVVLARELSVCEIAQVHRKTSMPLEVFVHGALCVAYSGQCLTSESLGGRSANRGQCAQACRLPYELVCDDRDVDLGAQKYLLSPQDLAAYALVPELIRAGVTALKIEGRLKTPEYVANVTRHYRRAIDAAVAGSPAEFTPRQVEEMELSFSRGFSTGWLRGCDHKALVPALSSAKQGVLAGTVARVRNGRVEVDLCGRLKAGDGAVFEGDRAAELEQGARVFLMFQNGRRVAHEVAAGCVELCFQPGAVDLERLWTGQKLWKNDDPALTRELRKSYSGRIRGRDVPVDIVATAGVGRLLRLDVRPQGLSPLTCATRQPLAAAIRHPLTPELLREQLGRLGGTGFALNQLTAAIEGTPMVPFSLLGELRREMVAGLFAARDEASLRRSPVASERVLPQLRREVTPSAPTAALPQLHVLCRSLAQLRVVLDDGAGLAYADFQDIRQYREAVRLTRAANAQLFLATPRIQKPAEMGVFHALARYGADGMLVRNLAGLGFCANRSIPCVADSSLNAANELTVDWLRSKGALRVTASYDLNRDQLLDLVRQAPPGPLEVVVHQHMPMFHMEHCVFCAVLSPGTNKTNCGRPCDRHEVRLRDRVGAEHPLKADVGCRNTLFNSVAQSGAEVVDTLLGLGVRHFRVELLGDDPPGKLRETVALYRDLIAGTVSARDVWTRLQATNRVGVTRGTLEPRRDPLAIL